MKIFPVLFMFFLLAACAPAATEAQVPTETPAPTNTPVPTATVIPSPTPTATPVAIDGVADVDGVRYVFDDKKQEWVALTELPADSGDLAVRVDDKGNVVAVDAKGKVAYEYVFSSREWEKVVPEVIVVGFDAKVNQAMKELHERNKDVELIPLYTDTGEVLKQGILFESGKDESVYLSGKFLGLVDLEKLLPEEYVQTQLAVLEITQEDGSTVLLGIQFWRGSEKSNARIPIVFLEGPVASSGLGDTPRQIQQHTFRQIYDFLVAEVPKMVGQQIILELPRPLKPDDDKYQTVELVVAALEGSSEADVDWSPTGRVLDAGAFVLPEDARRP
jgi:hypothetical protein